LRRVQLPQGGIKRLSISLLVDHAVRWEGSGKNVKRIVEAPAPEKLKVFRDLVAGATGFTQERGDQLIVETLPFESTLSAEPPGPAPAPTAPAPSTMPLPNWFPSWARQLGLPVLIGAGAGIVLVVLLGIVFLLLRLRKRGKASVTVQPALPPGNAMERAKAEDQALKEQMEAKLAEQAAIKDKLAKEALNSLKLPAVTTQKTEVLTKHITDEAKKDPVAMAQILRTWLNDAD
jgi:flagellar M-ring protein FliF